MDRHRTDLPRISRGFIPPIMLGLLLPISLAGQDHCADCRIAVDTVATLGSVDDPFSPSPRSKIAAFGDAFVVGPLDGMDDGVALYEPGQAPRLLGRAGDGPGEFRSVANVAASPESLHVFSAGRETIFDPALRVEGVRHIPVVGVMEAVAVTDASVVLGFGGSGPELRLLRISSEADSVLARWELPLEARNLVGFTRILGPATHDRFWIARNNAYEFELRSSHGEVLSRLSPLDDWFPSAATAPEEIINPLESPPPPVIAALREDIAGRLWVASLHAADPPREPAARPDASRAQYPRVVDSVVEALDPATGRSLGRRRIRGMALRFLGDRLLAVREVGPLDLTMIHILHIQLEEEVQ